MQSSNTISFPDWFSHVCQTPQTLREKCIAKFKRVTKDQESFLNALIHIFGRANLKQIAILLPEPLAQKMEVRFISRKERFHQILEIALIDLCADRHIHLDKLHSFYPVSVFSPESIQSRVIKEIAEHLLSLAMPIQESRRWQCYSVPSIKYIMDAQQNELEHAITVIFHSTLLTPLQRAPLSLTLAQEQALFKYAALKGHGRCVSWGSLLFLWAAHLKDDQRVYQELQHHFRFDKLLIPDKRESPPSLRNLQLSFQDFAVQQTMGILFQHPQTFLPAGTVDNELTRLFTQSLHAQQDAIYFIDYLHQLLQTNELPFPFLEALKTLNALIPNRSSPVYPFLHTSLHFFHCMVKFSIDKSHALPLFEAIHSLTEDEKKFYDGWIDEDFLRKPFQGNAFMQCAMKYQLPPNKIAHIILKFSVTVAAPAKTPILSPYLSCKEHIDLLQTVEEIFDLRLPASTVANLLLLQTMPSGIFTVMDAFVERRSEINADYLKALTVASQSHSLQVFVAKQTIGILFHHSQTLLPAGIIEEELTDLFSQSLRAQQEALEFIDYLHGLLQANEQPFPFLEALKTLNTLIPDHSNPIYSFLHTSLHFFHCMVKFSVERSHAAFLFKCIHSLERKEKKLYDRLIYENFQRESFQLNDSFIQYATDSILSLQQIAHIILKFSVTEAFPEKTDVPSPYLSAEKHIELLQQIKCVFGLILPAPLATDFLFFQTATPTTFATIESFAQIRLTIREQYLNTLAIPSKLYSSWEELASRLIGSIDLNPFSSASSRPKFLSEAGISTRLDIYPKTIFLFAVLLQMATYPLPMSPFGQWMPSKIDEGKFIFNAKTSYMQNRLELIHPEFPSGPARFCHWVLHPQTGEAGFSVSLINSLQHPKAACTFYIPLAIPLSKSWTSTFFNLLPAFIDTFAKECLSEEEEAKMKALTQEAYHLPDACFQMEGEPAKRFDAFLALFPPLRNLWKANESTFASDVSLVKGKLYTFIKTLRFYFKNAFFLVNAQEMTTSQTLDREGKSFLQIFSFNEMNKRGPDLAHSLEHLYQEIKSNPPNYTFKIDFDSNPSLPSSSLFLKIQRRSFQDEEDQSQECIDLTMELNGPKKLEPLTIVYDSFLNKQHFLQLMQWQMHLVSYYGLFDNACPCL